MTESTYQSTAYQSKRSSLKIFLIIALVFIFVAVTAGAAFWWWSNRPIKPVVLDSAELQTIAKKIEIAQAEPGTPAYVPGEKSIKLTERELNGLLNRNTNMGEQVKIELAQDEIHARIRTEIDKDFPFIGGKTLKAKARFTVKTEDRKPSIVLEDFTVWGISLPNDWLANLKGQNLLGTIGGDMTDNAFARGIKEISIKSGELNIELNE